MRLFVALNFPPELRDRLWSATEDLRAVDAPVRWVGRERLHLTLKFIGDVEDARETALADALERATEGHEPFPMRMRGAGAFPSEDRPRVLWIGVERSPALAALQSDVEASLAAAGVEPEERDFHPHVTLGRVRRRVGRDALRALAEATRGVAAGAEHEVAELHLMRSEQGPGGARYTVRSAHPLGGSSPDAAAGPNGDGGR